MICISVIPVITKNPGFSMTRKFPLKLLPRVPHTDLIKINHSNSFKFNEPHYAIY